MENGQCFKNSLINTLSYLPNETAEYATNIWKYNKLYGMTKTETL